MSFRPKHPSFLQQLGGLALAGALMALAIPTAQAARPNVIFILSDDLGWSDVTLYGTTELYETPHLERLAERGMIFSRAHSASPLCSPTRASVVTGQYVTRHGIVAPTRHDPKNVPLTASVAPNAPSDQPARLVQAAAALDNRLPTLGKRFREAGYATGHFGKWHLGRPPHSPLQHGFDIDLPHWPGPSPAGSFIAPWLYPDFDWKFEGEHIEDRMTREASAWMEEQVAAGKPFFLNYWQFSVHAPFDAHQHYIEEYRQKIDPNARQRSAVYAAMVRSMDDAIGTLLETVDALGIADNTIIIFTSDNGGNMYNGIPERDAKGREFVAIATNNAPLRGGKGNLFEGGTRVPTVIAWPGLTPPGSSSDALIQSADYYPTLLTQLGIGWPESHPVDGINFTPALRGESLTRPEGLITYFPTRVNVPDWLPPAIAIHHENWKLIRIFHDNPDQSHRYLLFNLDEDIGETTNLADRYPERVATLDRMVEDHLRESNAVIPEPNPNFNPDLYDPATIGGQPGGPRVSKGVAANQQRGREIRAQREGHSVSTAPQTTPAAPPPPPDLKTSDSAGGWSAGRETVQLGARQGALYIHSTGIDPWIQASLNQPIEGNFRVTVELQSSNTGAVRVFPGITPNIRFVPRTFVTAELSKANQWQTLEFSLEPTDTVHGLRINLPGSEGSSQIRSVSVRDASGRELQKWTF